jgi:hypothetical protein
MSGRRPERVKPTLTTDAEAGRSDMRMSEEAADDLRERVEAAVRAWFAEYAEDRETLTKIRYQVDVSYAEFRDAPPPAPERAISCSPGSSTTGHDAD